MFSLLLTIWCESKEKVSVVQQKINLCVSAGMYQKVIGEVKLFFLHNRVQFCFSKIMFIMPTQFSFLLHILIKLSPYGLFMFVFIV